MKKIGLIFFLISANLHAVDLPTWLTTEKVKVFAVHGFSDLLRKNEPNTYYQLKYLLHEKANEDGHEVIYAQITFKTSLCDRNYLLRISAQDCNGDACDASYGLSNCHNNYFLKGNKEFSI